MISIGDQAVNTTDMVPICMDISVMGAGEIDSDQIIPPKPRQCRWLCTLKEKKIHGRDMKTSWGGGSQRPS